MTVTYQSAIVGKTLQYPNDISEIELEMKFAIPELANTTEVVQTYVLPDLIMPPKIIPDNLIRQQNDSNQNK